MLTGYSLCLGLPVFGVGGSSTMVTSDGISSADWSNIEECAVEIVAASADELDCGLLRSNMRRLLRKLEGKYGRLPSILATEADYVDDHQLQLSLLKEAYVSACEIDDKKNTAFIAASLAEFYLDRVIDVKRAEFWSNRLMRALNNFSDSYLSSVLADVTEEIVQRKGIQVR